MDTKNNKIIDFGLFGKWSIDTLIAQTKFYSSLIGKKIVVYGCYLPQHIEDMIVDLKKEKEDLENIKLKKLKIEDFLYKISRIDVIDNNIKNYKQMKKLVVDECNKQKTKRK